MSTLYSVVQSFNGGEMAPAMLGQFQFNKYQTGLQKCRNFLVEPQGALRNRPGFAYVNKCKTQSAAPRLIPFTYSSDQTMVLEFGDGYIRFHHNGGTLMNGSSIYEIASPYSVNDVFDIRYVQSADVLTLVCRGYAPRELRRYGATDWRLVELQLNERCSAPTGVTVSQHINSSVTNPTDYKREYCVTACLEDGSNESTQSESVSIDCNPYGDGAYNTISWSAVSGAELYKIYRNQGGLWCYIGQTNGTSIVDDNIDPDASYTPPIYDSPFTARGGITSVAVTSSGSGYTKITNGVQMSSNGLYPTSYGYKSSDYKYTAKNLYATMQKSRQGTFTLQSFDSYPEYPTVTASIYDNGGAGTGAAVSIQCAYERSSSSEDQGSESSYWVTTYTSSTTVIGATITSVGQNYANPVLRLAYEDCYWVDIPLSTYSGGPSVNVSDSTGTGASFDVSVVNGQITAISVLSGGSNYTNPVLTISGSGAGAAATATVSGSGDYPGAVSYYEQRRVFAGTTKKPQNIWFTRTGSESNMSYSLPTRASDRIAKRVYAREANTIMHIVPLAKLILLTGAAEWVVGTANDDALTPDSITVNPQSYVGANKVQPIVAQNVAIYAASRGGHLRECGYNWQSGGYVSDDVCLFAPHLFDEKTVVDMAYQKAPFPVVYSVSSDGTINALTYVPEQKVGAFSVIETQGEFKSACVVAEGDEDILYVVVKRIINGASVYFIERMHEQNSGKSIYLDCGGSYTGEAKTTVTGLSWLEGMEVSIVADGAYEGTQTVSNGSVSLDFAASNIEVGLAYTSSMKTMPVAFSLQDASFGINHPKNAIEATIRVVDTVGVWAGPATDDDEDLTEYPSRLTEFAGYSPDATTDSITIRLNPVFQENGSIVVEQRVPLPCRIVSLATSVEVS